MASHPKGERLRAHDDQEVYLHLAERLEHHVQTQPAVEQRKVFSMTGTFFTCFLGAISSLV